MNKKFKETSIPEDFSKAIASQSILIGPSHAYRIATILFHATSSCLGAMKNPSVPKAIVYRSINNAFILGAKVEYCKNEDDPTNPSAGRWDYTWTTVEDDLKGAEIVEAATNSLVATFYRDSGISLYNLKFSAPDVAVLSTTIMAELIVNWLKENCSTDGSTTCLSLDGVFEGCSSVCDGKVCVGIVPDGEMKVLIKDDSAIQEK